MGNGQLGGTSHHFINDSSTDERQQQKQNNVLWTKNGRIPISKPQPTTKSSWQLARDVSMDMLGRKATKLSFKQGPTPHLLPKRRSVFKKYRLQPTPAPGKPLPTYRVPQMPTDKEIAEIAIAHQLSCDFCNGPCIGDYVRCRICIKTYHSLCLYERGHVSDQSFSLPRLGKQDWSCPDCGDLTRLLTQDEINYLIHVFEQIDRNKNGYIIMEDFLEFCASGKLTDNFHLFNPNNDELEKIHFNLMDSRNKGVVTWTDFAIFYTCKLIAAKNKTQLTTKLSKKELVFAKNLFCKDEYLQIDNENNIIITKEHFNRIAYDLTLMIKKKYGGPFIDAILHENQNMNETIEKFSVIGWDEFLRQISIPIILNRSNYDIKNSQPRRASIPKCLTKTTVISHVNLTSNNIETKQNLSTISPDLSYSEVFRKHGKILEKLNQRDQQDEIKKKQFGTLINCSIIEDDDEENFELPKLKPNAKDDRQSISEPWSVVKEMEHLRTQPILITTTRIQMLKV